MKVWRTHPSPVFRFSAGVLVAIAVAGFVSICLLAVLALLEKLPAIPDSALRTLVALAASAIVVVAVVLFTRAWDNTRPKDHRLTAASVPAGTRTVQAFKLPSGDRVTVDITSGGSSVIAKNASSTGPIYSVTCSRCGQTSTQDAYGSGPMRLACPSCSAPLS